MGRSILWKPLILSTSGKPLDVILVKKFDHKDEQCPNKTKVAVSTKVSDDGFVEVTRNQGKGKSVSKPRHIDGVRLNKPKPKYYYRPISKPTNVYGVASSSQMNIEASTSQPKATKDRPSSQPSSNIKDLSSQAINIISLENYFNALQDQDDIFEVDKTTW